MKDLAHTIEALRPILPAKDFAVSERFYVNLGFLPKIPTEKLVEMHLGDFSFLLQD